MLLQLRVARDRFDEMSKPGALRACVDGLATKSVLHPLQTRKNRAALVKARKGLAEAREFSAQCRIGTIREHRGQGKLKAVEANVCEVKLPARQMQTPKTKESRSRLLRKVSTPWASANPQAAHPPRIDLSAGVAVSPEGRGSKVAKTEKKEMPSSLVAAIVPTLGK